MKMKFKRRLRRHRDRRDVRDRLRDAPPSAEEPDVVDIDPAVERSLVGYDE